MANSLTQRLLVKPGNRSGIMEQTPPRSISRKRDLSTPPLAGGAP